MSRNPNSSVIFNMMFEMFIFIFSCQYAFKLHHLNSLLHLHANGGNYIAIWNAANNLMQITRHGDIYLQDQYLL